MQTRTIDYKTPEKADTAASKLARQGWQASSRETVQPRSGCKRTIMLGGIGALIFKPKPVTRVTYTHE